MVCGPIPTPYAVEVTPMYQSDRLVPGPVSSNTWAEYCTPGGCFGMGTDSDLPLRPTR